MQIHVLTGDSLAQNFPVSIDGEKIVSRECLIEGSLAGKSLPEFWKTRAAFIKSAYGEDENSYDQNVKSEYEKLRALSSDDTIHLWFEYDLFCQVNMWFTIYLLAQSQIKNIYRVAPIVRNDGDLYSGFGNLNENQLRQCFDKRAECQAEDVLLGVNLWQAYQNDDLNELQRLSETKSSLFPHLQEACAAEIERKTERRPEKTLRAIAASGVTEFHQLFAEFSQQEGIYGFGDSQVKRILAAMA